MEPVISSVQNRPGNGFPNTGGPAPAGPVPQINADFQTFLRMLTTQLQNQDPMNPMESSDFSVQLATFSGVEQQVMTNQLLTSLSARMELSELSSWHGRPDQCGHLF